ncbi:MAG: hypothetical protein ABID87_08945 [Chloroflexota bacterium]
MSGQYEVLNPWADVTPVKPRGIQPRVADLSGKTIGLFSEHFKVASQPILTVVEKRLRERFPTANFRWFSHDYNLDIAETKEFPEFQEWVKGIDTAVAAVGD